MQRRSAARIPRTFASGLGPGPGHRVIDFSAGESDGGPEGREAMDDGTTGVRPCPLPSRVSESPAQKEHTQSESFSLLRIHLWLTDGAFFSTEQNPYAEGQQLHRTPEADTDVPRTTSNAIASEPTMQPGCPSPRGCCCRGTASVPEDIARSALHIARVQIQEHTNKQRAQDALLPRQ
ncbi:hypothetical protein CSAL01_10002 [Colletotrichum salicis]|uniref:Uncharacterized protein n=1 Tax=Colletotrichum salicis TaxID=1209931 RepID=A0A135V1F1_9PEZI|nr:hypothetical protein CSAL01_10002 [Colletotrichum salicis]